MDILNIIKKHSCLVYNDENNEQARDALMNFTNKLSECKPSTTYKPTQLIHTNYYIYLYLLKKELDRNNYIRACSEIGSLNYRVDILQGRVLFSLLDILKIHFGM